MRTGLVVVCWVVLGLGIATPAAAEDTREGPAWKLYDDAFTALEAGEHERARELLRTLIHDHPGEPATAKATEVIAALDAGPGVIVEETPPPPPRGREQPTSSARAELALFQMLIGMSAGVELCVAAECDEAGPVVALSLLGGVVGVAASLAARKVTPGARASYNSGAAWGTINAGVLLVLAEPDSSTAIGAGMIAGQAAGLIVGAIVQAYRPTAGQVGLANTTGMWSAALTAGTYAALDDDISEESIAGTILVAGDLGIILGATLAHRYPNVTRGQTLAIDAGGIMGALVGAGGGILVGGDSIDERTTAGLGVVGAAVGLGVAAYVTRHWDDAPEVPARATVTPTRGGAIATLGMDF